jgi:hypothetical protein
MEKAAELLLHQGYERLFKLNRSQEAAQLESLGQHTFVRKYGAGMVDVHTELMPGQFFFPLDFRRAWDCHVTETLGGQEVPSLCPEDVLLLLSAHGSKHHWERLRWMCDITYLLHRRRKMNWDCVLQEAERLASQRMLFLSLLLARKLLRARIPQKIRQRIHMDPVVASLASQVTRNLFCSSDQRRGGIASAMFHLEARERLRDGIRYSVSLATSPTIADYEFVPLPPQLYFLYYFLRPIRLARHYAQKLFSRLCVRNLYGLGPVS